MVQIHHEIRRIIVKEAMPTGSIVDSSLPKKSVSRLKATENAIVLSINDVRPTNHATVYGL